jgi:hypothetical protein
MISIFRRVLEIWAFRNAFDRRGQRSSSHCAPTSMSKVSPRSKIRWSLYTGCWRLHRQCSVDSSFRAHRLCGSSRLCSVASFKKVPSGKLRQQRRRLRWGSSTVAQRYQWLLISSDASATTGQSCGRPQRHPSNYFNLHQRRLFCLQPVSAVRERTVQPTARGRASGARKGTYSESIFGSPSRKGMGQVPPISFGVL